MNSYYNEIGRHHYRFTHHVLLEAAMRLKEGVFEYLGAGSADSLSFRINDLLMRADSIVDSGIPRDFDSREIDVSHHLFGSAPCVLITMPPPKCISEAHFVAIVSRIHKDKIEEPRADSDSSESLKLQLKECPLNYYILEQSLGSSGEAVARFCEWGAGKIHYNYGKVPFCTRADFVAFLEEFALARAVEEGRFQVSNGIRVNDPAKTAQLPGFSMYQTIQEIISE